MGIVRMGPPEELVLALRDALGAETLIETGTFQGVTTEWAGRHFKQVHSIERAEQLYLEAKEKLSPMTNVSLYHGDSREFMPGLIGALDSPAILWLDAHWCGRDTAGKEDECPLLDELADANRSSQPLAILVDDARYFLCPPPAPHNLADWPDLDAVVRGLANDGQRYVAVTEDIFAAVPMSVRDVLVGHCRELATKSLTDKKKIRRRIRRAVHRLRDMFSGKSA